LRLCGEERDSIWLVLHKSHINLQFWNGVDLTNPRYLLEGTGKKMRHIKIRNPDDMRTDIFKDMLKDAADA
jgi:hypothetical protein